nr:flagellar export chaperone FlgN [uncultured Massilia sp.]
MSANRMTRDQAVARLLDGIQGDLATCGAVRDLLERQFQAALRRSGTELATLAEQLMPQLDAMEERRKQRVQLVRALLGPQATMGDLFGKLDAARRGAASEAWAQLEALVRDCKEATLRNGTLMAEQHSVMQRVLYGEDATYAPR